MSDHKSGCKTIFLFVPQTQKLHEKKCHFFFQVTENTTHAYDLGMQYCSMHYIFTSSMSVNCHTSTVGKYLYKKAVHANIHLYLNNYIFPLKAYARHQGWCIGSHYSPVLLITAKRNGPSCHRNRIYSNKTYKTLRKKLNDSCVCSHFL